MSNAQREAEEVFIPIENCKFPILQPRTLVECAPISIPVKRTHPHAVIPALGTHGAAAFDLCAVHDGVIPNGHSALVETSLCFEIPYGYVGMICSRSGLAAKKSVFVLNAPGIADSDYRGSIKLILQNMGGGYFQYLAGDRLAQIMFVKHEHVVFREVSELSDTARGEGGFGSTGVGTK